MRTVGAILAPILFATFASAAAQDSAAQPAKPATAPPCSAPEHQQFDFWLGDWEVKSADGQVAGSNRIEKILNGCVLLESWEGTGGSIGKSFNMYYARDESWRQTWVDGNGSRLDLAGGLVGEEMVLSGETPGRDGGVARHEIRWTPLDDGRVRQRWQVSTDGGETWREVFLGFYSRR